MAAPGVRIGLAASLLWLAVSPPEATALSFLDIAASVRPVSRPNTVPEFILIAEMANRRTSPRPTGAVPDFVLIGESVHHGGQGIGVEPSRMPEVGPTTSAFEVSSKRPPPTSTSTLENIDYPDSIDFSLFTEPAQEVATPAPTPVEEMMPDDTSTSTEEGIDEDFDLDNIYFEERDKKVGDPRWLTVDDRTSKRLGESGNRFQSNE